MSGSNDGGNSVGRYDYLTIMKRDFPEHVGHKPEGNYKPKQGYKPTGEDQNSVAYIIVWDFTCVCIQFSFGFNFCYVWLFLIGVCMVCARGCVCGVFVFEKLQTTCKLSTCRNKLIILLGPYAQNKLDQV